MIHKNKKSYIFALLLVMAVLVGLWPGITFGEQSAADLTVSDSVYVRIGETGYATLDEALDAVSEGETIQLLADVSDNNGISLSGKKFNLDLNGNTLTINNDSGCGLELTKGSEVNVTGPGNLDISSKLAGLNVNESEFISSDDTTVTIISTRNPGISADSRCTVYIHGDVTGVTGILANSNNHITVSGTVTASGTSNDHAVSLMYYGNNVSVGSAIVSSGNGAGVNIENGGTVTVGTATVPGQVTGRGNGIWARMGSDPAIVTVYGDVEGGAHGICFTDNADIKVYGNVTSTSDRSDSCGIWGLVNTTTSHINIDGDVRGVNGIKIHGDDSEVTVDGDVTATGTDSDENFGVSASYATVYVSGSITARDCIGAYSAGSSGITVNKTISAAKYIKVKYAEKGVDDNDPESTQTGYLQYSSGDAYVWVKGETPGAEEGPTITGAVMDSQNQYITITFSEPVYGDAEKKTGIRKEDFILTFESNGGVVKDASIRYVHSLPRDLPPEGGETTFKLLLGLMDGPPTGKETITIAPAANSIFNDSGTAVNVSQTTGPINLRVLPPQAFTGDPELGDPQSSGSHTVILCVSTVLDGTLDYVVFPEGLSTEPSAQQIKDHAAIEGVDPLNWGQGLIGPKEKPIWLSTGLDHDKTYDVYLVAEAGNNNFSEVKHIKITTPPSIEALTLKPASLPQSGGTVTATVAGTNMDASGADWKVSLDGGTTRIGTVIDQTETSVTITFAVPENDTWELRTDTVNLWVNNVDTGSGATVTVAGRSMPGTWYRVGGTLVSEEDTASYISLDLAEDGTPYVAYCDVNDGYKPTVRKYTEDEGWQPIGPGRVSELYSSFLSLQVYNGVPYLAFSGTTNVFQASTAMVMKYDAGENKWTDVGSVPSSSPWHDSLYIGDDGTLYLAFLDKNYSGSGGGIPKVMKYDPAKDEWVALPDPEELRLRETEFSLSVYDGKLYMAYRDSNNNNKAKVKVYDFSTKGWSDLGGSASTHPVQDGISLSLAEDGTPYLAYGINDTYVKGPTVVKFDGTEWKLVGNRLSSSPSAINHLRVYDDTPYVAYKGYEGYVQVKRYEGSWTDVGTGLTKMSNTMSFAMHEGTPYVAYTESSRAVVMTTVPQASMPTITGVIINGEPKYGEALNASITYSAEPEREPTLTYQWQRDGVDIPGAVGSSYTLVQEDIGATITVTVTARDTATGSVTSEATAAVQKADGPAAPESPPTLEGKTHNSVTLTANADYQFSKDGGLTWQDSNVFTDLSPSTEYTFVARFKETATENASAPSAGLRVTTNAAPSGGGGGGGGGGRRPHEEPPVVVPPEEVPAAPAFVIVLTPDSNIALVNNLEVDLDAAPFINTDNDRAMVPIRFVSEQLGAYVEWLADTRQVRITLGEKTILLIIGSNQVQVNEQLVEIDSTAMIANGRTFVPLRFVSETLGANVHWDDVTGKIMISK